MNTHRFSRLKIRAALGGWIVVIGALGTFIWQLLTGADFLLSRWPQGKTMPIEVWVFVCGLAWLLLVAFWPELDQAEQPEVGLVWDWSEDQKKLSLSELDKGIFVDNRSDVWIHNIEIHPIKLAQELMFERITEIAPGDTHPTLARWGNKSTIGATYHQYFCEPPNVEVAMKRKWLFTKTHNRDLSDQFLKIPMRISYEANNRVWESKWTFICDVGDESMFELVSKKRV